MQNTVEVSILYSCHANHSLKLKTSTSVYRSLWKYNSPIYLLTANSLVPSVPSFPSNRVVFKSTLILRSAKNEFKMIARYCGIYKLTRNIMLPHRAISR